MTKRVVFLSITVFLVFACVGFAQPVTMNLLSEPYGDLTGPYQGNINGGATIYMMCDDFTTDIPEQYTWYATGTPLVPVSSGVKFWDGGAGPYAGATVQQDYDAAGLLFADMMSSLGNQNAQTNDSYAIWELMDPGLGTANPTYDPTGGAAQALIGAALAAVAHGPVAVDYDITVWTPTGTIGNPSQGLSSSQEFLTFNVPEPGSAAILGFDLLSALAGVVLVLRYRRARA